MANFMQAFEDQREDYLSHYGVKGQRWGVITSEYEPVGDQPGGQEDSDSGLDMKWDTPAMREKERRQSEYSQQDQESMQQSADAIRQADAESVKDKRKRIVKNIVKGVAIGAIVAGIAAGAVKGYAKKQTGEKQDLATSIGIVGQKLRSKPGQIGDAVKKGFNMDTGATKAANEAEAARKRAERVQAFKNAAGKVGNAVGTAAGKVGSAVEKARSDFNKKAEAGYYDPERAMDYMKARAKSTISSMKANIGAINPKTGMLRNRYIPNRPKRYEEAPRSRIYRG